MQHGSDLPDAFHLEYDSRSLFVGRERELALLGELLAEPACQLITLVGPGGVGKTRLAIEAARQASATFARGTLVELAGTLDDGDLLDTIATALGISSTTSHSTFSLLVQRLRGSKQLLVLDNCEHLVSLTGLVARLLVEAPGIKILATSRSPLGLRAERLVMIEGLALPPTTEEAPEPTSYAAGRLLVSLAPLTVTERSLTAQEAYSLSLICRLMVGATGPAVMRQEAQAIATICRLVGGSPLALELAASQLYHRSAAEIAAELTQNLTELVSVHDDQAERHRSTRVVFEWSWRLLSPYEQRLLAALSVFRGGATSEAIEAILDATPATLDRLVERSLLRRGSTGRYAIHDLVRQFAAERLSEQTQGVLSYEQVHDRYSHYYLSLAARHGELLDGPAARVAMEQLQAERDNIRAAWALALESADGALIVASAAAVARMHAAGSLAESATMLHQAIIFLQRRMRYGARLEQALLCLYSEHAWMLAWLGRPGEAIAAAQKLIDLAVRSADRLAEARGRLRIGEARMIANDFVAARQDLEAAKALAGTLGDGPQVRLVVAHCFYGLATLNDLMHQPVDLAYAQAALALYSDLGVTRYESLALNRLGNQYRRLGYLGRSLACRRGAAALIDQQGDPDIACRIYNDLGEIYHQLGLYAEAIDAYEYALAISRRIDNRVVEVSILEGLGRTYLSNGDVRRARALLEQGLQLDILYQTNTQQGYLYNAIGHTYEQEGRLQEAAHFYQQALSAWAGAHQSDARSEPMAGLLRVMLARGAVVRAGIYADQILAICSGPAPVDALDPILVLWSCWMGLHAASDPRAAEVLQRAYRLLQDQAAAIDDPLVRRALLEAVATHRAVIAAFEGPSGLMALTV